MLHTIERLLGSCSYPAYTLIDPAYPPIVGAVLLALQQINQPATSIVWNAEMNRSRLAR